ncbi:response regulator [Allosphingosinicella flava]|uniref:Response regulator n=1 Tax=Allosphingosinicella flava TaxID=2771430 RepID=A0A7T2LMV1_9SPHN|nr:response regulator [Sphingosinicella flava]QPQ55673.1 response regulator [Sphingosinicella flava]
MSNSRSILVVEDEPLIAMMLEDFLESLGHKCVAIAESVEEAMIRIDEGGFDVAIMDVHLKNERIWPVADRLAQEGRPFILATGGHIEPPPAEHAGAPVLAKPYTVDAIDPAINAALAERTL